MCPSGCLLYTSYPLKDITRVCYNEIEEIEVYKGKRRVFKVSSGTYGMDELVEWFRAVSYTHLDVYKRQSS